MKTNYITEYRDRGGHVLAVVETRQPVEGGNWKRKEKIYV